MIARMRACRYDSEKQKAQHAVDSATEKEADASAALERAKAAKEEAIRRADETIGQAQVELLMARSHKEEVHTARATRITCTYTHPLHLPLLRAVMHSTH